MMRRYLTFLIACFVSFPLAAAAGRRNPLGISRESITARKGAMGRLEVRVAGATLKAMGHVHLLIRHPHRAKPRMGASASAAGHYARRMSAGRWLVIAHRPGAGSGRAAVTVRAGQTAIASITLRGARHSFHEHQSHLLGTRVHKIKPSAGAKLPGETPLKPNHQRLAPLLHHPANLEKPEKQDKPQ